MIASPGDVHRERDLVREIIHQWNDIHSMREALVLMPVGWDTHAFPELGDRAQALINKNVLDKCDLLVAIFWTRIGTSTGAAESGTVEEIRKHVEAGKPAMVYFSTAPVAPQTLDPEQYKQLTSFKTWCKSMGLIEEYENVDEFGDKFRRQIQGIIRGNDYVRELISATSYASIAGANEDIHSTAEIRLTAASRLSSEAVTLIIEASKDLNGTILIMRHLGGQSISTNGVDLVHSNDRRQNARWEAAIEELEGQRLIADLGFKKEIFQITQRGFEAADQLLKEVQS
jgi:hypothetical protein